MLNQHKTNKWIIKEYNRNRPLEAYLIPLLEDKKEVMIADIASGPFSKIGRYKSGVKIEIYPSDRQGFTDFYNKYSVEPIYPIAYQNMEGLTYADNYFDIVHCDNALDHTVNAPQAVREMIRVCKVGGYVWIRCHLDQLETGHKHYWNAKEDGTLDNKKIKFNLKELGFEISYQDKGGERRYNHIVAVLKKK